MTATLIGKPGWEASGLVRIYQFGVRQAVYAARHEERLLEKGGDTRSFPHRFSSSQRAGK
ncbi:hypothetical protein GCM10007276_12180 [Agaricicola taiwanensis]|uniref:Uncharacterized protein n=1 Tax=Agaricicola taiwanensis TaxID=591372 RepID=A0A8J2YCB0_9RHOB|nr:hypothetical protein GCM10007276_12180 [Agaricicola taiwanensis]